MELTQELLIAALDALLDQSLNRATLLRQAAGDCTPGGEAEAGFLDAAALHSRRLRAASDIAQEIRANGVDNVTLVK